MQRMQECRLTSLDNAGHKVLESLVWLLQTSGRNETFHYSHGFTCTFSVRRHVFMWKPQGLFTHQTPTEQRPGSSTSLTFEVWAWPHPLPAPSPYSSTSCPAPGITSTVAFLKAPYLTGILRELSVYGVFATYPTWELPSKCSSFHVYYKPHEQLWHHSRLVQTVKQAKATLKRWWPKQILLTLFINPFWSTWC